MNPRQQLLETLEKDAEGLKTANHERFMQDAAECMKRGGSPQDAMTLLESMENTPFASRKDTRDALVRVMEWLRPRVLQKEPPSAQELIWQLGWLRRMARASREIGRIRQKEERGPRLAPNPPEVRTAPPPNSSVPTPARLDLASSRAGKDAAGQNSSGLGTMASKLSSLNMDSILKKKG